MGLGIECDPSDWRIAARLVAEGLAERVRIIRIQEFGDHAFELASRYRVFMVASGRVLEFPFDRRFGWSNWSALELNYERTFKQIEHRWTFWSAWFISRADFSANETLKQLRDR